MNTTESNLSTFHDQKSKHDVYLAFDAINICISIFICIGNTLVIISVARYRPLQTKANVFLVNLAVADVLVGLVTIYCTVTDFGVHDGSHDSRIECIFCVAMSIFANGNSLFAIILVATERFVKIVRTEKYTHVYRKGPLIAMISVPWITIALTCGTLFIWNTYQEGTLCHLKVLAPKIFQITVMNCFMILVILTIVSLYCAIVYKVLQHKRQVASTLSRDGSRENWSSGSRRMNTVVVIIGTLLVTMTPFIVLSFFESNDSVLYLCVRPISSTLFDCSSFVNPVIYAWKIPEFRMAFKAVFTCRKQLLSE